MEESKVEKCEVERMGLWPYSKGAKPKQIARYYELSTKVEYL